MKNPFKKTAADEKATKKLEKIIKLLHEQADNYNTEQSQKNRIIFDFSQKIMHELKKV